MTILTLRALETALAGPDLSQAGTVTVEYRSARGGPLVHRDGLDVVLGRVVRASVTGGVPDEPLDLMPTPPGAFADVRVSSVTAQGILRLTTLIPDIPTVDIGDLVPVDPSTLAPSEEGQAAWDAAVAAAQAAVVAAQTAADSAAASVALAGEVAEQLEDVTGHVAAAEAAAVSAVGSAAAAAVSAGQADAAAVAAGVSAAAAGAAQSDAAGSSATATAAAAAAASSAGLAAASSASSRGHANEASSAARAASASAAAGSASASAAAGSASAAETARTGMIVTGTVVGDDLVLGTVSGGTVNAGSVRGSPGSPTAFELRGTGRPEGVVSAPVGTYYTDVAATNGAIRWVKTVGSGSTGWRVLFGDTGWRDITAACAPWVITSGKVLLTRVNARVTLVLAVVTLDASMLGNVVYYPLPAGFAMNPTSTDLAPIYRTVDVPQLVRVTNGAQSRIGLVRPGAASIWSGTWSWPAADIWPTTLPGVPA